MKNLLRCRFSTQLPTLLALLSVAVLLQPLQASEAAHHDAGSAKHYLGIFIGILDVDGETDTTLGIEYEYKFTPAWGVGLVYEDASNAHHGDGVSSTIAALYFHPHAGWRLAAGLGREKVGGDHGHTEDLARIGVAYDFHVGGFGVAPTLNFDRVDGETAKVYGIAIIKGF